MNFWHDLAKELELWNNSISTPENCPEIYAEELNEWLKDRRKEGDEACSFWIEQEHWPEMSSDLRWQIGLRMTRATMIALTLSTKGWPNPRPWERNEALEWLLIETWSLTLI